jgi:hypothetical protein
MNHELDFESVDFEQSDDDDVMNADVYCDIAIAILLALAHSS